VTEWSVEWYYLGLRILTLNVNLTGARAVIHTSATLMSSMGRRSVGVLFDEEMVAGCRSTLS
jgi:hypothetical protein